PRDLARPSLADDSCRTAWISLRAYMYEPSVVSTVKMTNAVALVRKWRRSNCSCLRLVSFNSACRFLSRLSLLMTRLRASITSLRSSVSSRSTPSPDCALALGLGVPWLCDSSFITVPCALLAQQNHPTEASPDAPQGCKGRDFSSESM